MRLRRRERGQTLIVFALAFALFLFGVTCLVADTSFLYRWSQRVQAAAQLAAQSGADAVDPRYLYGQSGAIVDVSPQDRRGGLYAFQRACIQAGDQSATVPRQPPSDLTPKTVDDAQTPEGTACDTDGCRVFAQIVRIIDLPIPFPGFPQRIAVRGQYFAAPVIGSNTAQAVCTGSVWVPAAP
jgi:hypothetical protein